MARKKRHVVRVHRRRTRSHRLDPFGDLPRAAGRAGSMLLSTVRSVMPDPSRWMGW